MRKDLSALIVGFVVSVMACQSPENPEVGNYMVDDDAEVASPDDEILATPPPPQDAVPGDLGGPCGINYESCPGDDGVKMAKKFAALKKSGFVESCGRQGDTLGFTTQFNVSRLVNDHAQKNDRLAIFWSETAYSTGVIQSTVSYARNGVFVASAYVTTNSQDGSTVVSDEFVDVYKGGAEVNLALADKRVWNRVVDKVEQCRNKELNEYPEFNVLCWSCYGLKYGLIGFLARGASAGAKALKDAGKFVPSVEKWFAAGAVADQVIDDFWECTKMCKVGQCEVEMYDCSKTCNNSACYGQCKDKLQICCHTRTDGAGVCSTGGDGKCFACKVKAW
jgi:hypothetical protein